MDLWYSGSVTTVRQSVVINELWCAGAMDNGSDIEGDVVIQL